MGLRPVIRATVNETNWSMKIEQHSYPALPGSDCQFNAPESDPTV